MVDAVLSGWVDSHGINIQKFGYWPKREKFAQNGVNLKWQWHRSIRSYSLEKDDTLWQWSLIFPQKSTVPLVVIEAALLYGAYSAPKMDYLLKPTSTKGYIYSYQKVKSTDGTASQRSRGSWNPSSSQVSEVKLRLLHSHLFLKKEWFFCFNTFGKLITLIVLSEQCCYEWRTKDLEKGRQTMF